MILNETMLHGGDYNPDQWLDAPEILEKDIVLMKQAGVNCVSLGIFAWAALEPEEGQYTLDWLIQRVDALHANGIYTILATPSGARPAWMAQRYPEVLRVAPDLTRNQMGGRHNHCYTSPVYRQKVWEMNKRLSQALGKHPGVILWHLSNEYGGACYCPLCQAEFRNWLKAKYSTLDALNKAWWTSFWSHTYTDWSQIEAPGPRGESLVYGLNLDWQRFVTDRTVDFCRWEKEAVREGGSSLPVTTNFMTYFWDLNYAKFRDLLDVVSWDSYPTWHTPEKSVTRLAAETACAHDFIRGFDRDKRSFLLMESTPSIVNWQPVAKLKRPGMHMLSSMQAVAHGANSIQYFQWRKSRGCSEKFHGAVVDHYGEADTRVFGDVAALGHRLEGLSALCKSAPKPEVAILFDQENRWALDTVAAPRNNGGMHYLETVQDHYEAFWKLGVPVDVIGMENALNGYKLIVAPMLYMQRAGIAEKLRAFVAAGGTLVGTYWSGVVDETDLTFLGGTPHDLMDVFGLRVEEIDALYDGEANAMQWQGKRYTLRELCERVKTNAAQTLAAYESDFYAEAPALCVNEHEKGKAYYLAARAEQAFYDAFYAQLVQDTGVRRALDADLPEGVTAGLRRADDNGPDYIIAQNFTSQEAKIRIKKPVRNHETGEVYTDMLTLLPYGALILTEA